MDFTIGKGQSLFPEWMRTNVEVRVRLDSADGRTAFGCSADWPSFGWLDKRTEVQPRQKLKELLVLVGAARDAFIANAQFDTPFDCWWQTRTEFLQQDRVRSAVPLCSSFAMALIERALVDAWCRIEGVSFHAALSQNGLSFQPERIHPELKGFSLANGWPREPLGRVNIRHTIGLNDPLTQRDVSDENRLDDGQPHTLEDYVAQDGIQYFKIKVCGGGSQDLDRLQQIWRVIQSVNPRITLDGNEAWDDAAEFGDFVKTLAHELPEIFERILYIEQPLNRLRTLDTGTSSAIQAISLLKPLIIDEADGHLHAFAEATQIGYQGVSHKNCKGLFKSLANFALCKSRNRNDQKSLFLSAEDLTNMPMVALQQDFAVLAALGLRDAERNAHHFFPGLAHLSESEQRLAIEHHPDLYEEQNGERFMRIENGTVDITSLATSGLGVAVEPDWGSMASLDEWAAGLK